MTKDQLIRRFKSNANMADEQEDIEAYINTLEIGRPLDVEEIKQGRSCISCVSFLLLSFQPKPSGANRSVSFSPSKILRSMTLPTNSLVYDE
jgi:hypothetical protein